jgi:DNA helicase II / ATP-dependent DNA helicase PcrA
VRALADQGITVVAIGDDDQSIYGWRHAAPQGIRNFPTEFDTGADYHLTVSRRCGRSGLDAANELIETAPDRAPKPRLSTTDEGPRGEFAYLRFPSTRQEVQGVAQIVAHRVRQGVEARDVLLLVRSNLQTWHRQLEPGFNEAGLTIGSTGWITDALSDRELRRGIALGRLAENREDSLAWWSLTEGLAERVGPTFTNYIYDTRGSGVALASECCSWPQFFAPAAVRIGHGLLLAVGCLTGAATLRRAQRTTPP